MYRYLTNFIPQDPETMSRLRTALFLIAFRLVPALIFPASQAFAAEEGTLGVTVQQLYSQREPSHKGNLVVLDVRPKSAAADAGIHAGDLIIETNGVPVQGRDLGEIRAKDLNGAVGGTVKVKVLRPQAGEPREATLIRRPWPPYENPASDPFHYSGPGNWRSERHQFPLPWAPSLPYHGLADLLFIPAFSDESSPDFFSYIGFWWIEGKPRITAEQLQRNLFDYYRGLSEDFAQEGKFTVDLSRVSVSLKTEGELFRGDVSTYSFTGKLIVLHTDATLRTCSGSDHSVVFFSLSPQDRGQPVWKTMRSIGDSFVCRP
jgi:membrane-associated protease RseP (regulator of RpoE activity)